MGSPIEKAIPEAIFLEGRGVVALSGRLGLCRGVQRLGHRLWGFLCQTANQEKGVSLRTLSADNAFPIA